MHQAQSFILNAETQSCSDTAGKVLADLIRNNYQQKGTTIACREGDCGACTVLVGEGQGETLKYRTLTSCISPWPNAAGKHVVTVEGLNPKATALTWNPIQKAFAAAGASQCGYCTPGFIISLAGFLINHQDFTVESAIEAIDGNICRCTGYKSIERAIASLIATYAGKIPSGTGRIQALVDLELLPAYFAEIPARLTSLQAQARAATASPVSTRLHVGGGTDLWVQKPDELFQEPGLAFCAQTASSEESIRCEDQALIFTSDCRIEDMKQSPLVQKHLPKMPEFLRLFASTPIRHQGTLTGNLVNASPIGDLANFFLAMDASLVLEHGISTRTVALKSFYLGYKQKDLKAEEKVTAIIMPLPQKNSYVNFEKVSRRKHLDIASVTTSMHVRVENDQVTHASFSAGGVAATPFYLKLFSDFLLGKKINPAVIRTGVNLALSEVKPISDVRGSKEYKTLLLRQLLYAHFLTCFPERLRMEDLCF